MGGRHKPGRLRGAMETEQEAQDRHEVAHQRREAAVRAIEARLEKLAPLIADAVDADAQCRATANRIGLPSAYHDVRERLAKRLHWQLRALRPYIPYEGEPDI